MQSGVLVTLLLSTAGQGIPQQGTPAGTRVVSDASGAAGRAEADGDRPWWAALGGRIALDNFVGTGTFVPHRHADNPYYASMLTLQPSWALSKELHLGLFYAFIYEWTNLVTPCHAPSGPRAAGAPAEDCSDTEDPSRRRHDQFDLELSLSHSSLFAEGPFNVSGWAGVAVPTSRYSFEMGNLFTLGGGGSADLVFGPLSLYLAGSIRKFFPTAEARVLTAAEVEAQAAGGVPIGRCAAFRQDACVVLGGFAPSWRGTIIAGATVQIPWIEGLSATVSAGYIYDRRFGRSPDAFTSTRTDADGRAVVNGVNESDLSRGLIDLTYHVDAHFSVSAGVFSFQPARTADGKGLRFPFFDFISPAQNYTAWYLGGAFLL